MCHYIASNKSLGDHKRISKWQRESDCKLMLFKTGHYLFLLPRCCLYEEKKKDKFKCSSFQFKKLLHFLSSCLVKYPFQCFTQGLNQSQKHDRWPMTEVGDLWRCSDISDLFPISASKTEMLEEWNIHASKHCGILRGTLFPYILLLMWRIG